MHRFDDEHTTDADLDAPIPLEPVELDEPIPYALGPAALAP